jgi:DNA polymerase III epsilon subunit-like protein
MNRLTARDQAILWARQILQTDFIALDTETTGLENDAEACQIGIVDRAGNILLDSYIKPGQPIPARATQLHGISDETVKDAPTILDLESQLAAALRGRMVIVYNAEYDARILRMSFLRAGAQRHGAPYRLPETCPVHRNNFRPECAMEVFAAFYGDWNDYRGNYHWQKLTTAARYFGVSTDGAHGAVADALMTLKVIEGMANSKLSQEDKDEY